MPLGPRKKLIAAIAELTAPSGAHGGNQEAATEHGATHQAERRQLTVMFCDLVGSTALSRELDPEDLRDLIRSYQDSVAGAVTRYSGYVAKYLGDGVLAYFGWPMAHEDQAERAVRAGLDAVKAVERVRFGDDRALQARVGISTGQVVVGDLVGDVGMDAEAVIGETPNLAARLQQFAAPGAVVIGASTRDLLHQTFDLVDMGQHVLKGFEDEVRVWRVEGEGAAESRFEARRGGAAAPMVGRDEEMLRLLELWRRACDGEGQVVTVLGEAGIGKSRLTEAINDELSGQAYIRLRYHCSPYHAASPLFPAIQQLRRAAKISAADDDEEKLDKLERLLSRSHSDIVETRALFAELMSLPYEKRYGALDMSPQQLKQATMEALLAELRLLAEARPILFIYEDAHWIDPTSLELLSMMIEAARQSRILLIITHRPEWQLEDQGYTHVTPLTLNRLGRQDNELIARAVANEDISAEVVEYIVSRTDGVPLFAEELTKTLAESGFRLTEADVPATLQASLLARLDRLGSSAKEIAQIGAVIGRDFGYELLLDVVGRARAELDGELDLLVRSGLILRKGSPGKSFFTFKHALVQDVTYGSLLKSRRQAIHGDIARALQSRMPAREENQPELLARHFASAGMMEEAGTYWRRAADIAVSRSANQEALKHFEQTLELLSRQLETVERDRRELDIRVAHGVPAIAAFGYASPEVEAIYLRARELGARLGDDKRMFPVVRGLWNLYVDRADMATAVEYAQALVAQAKAEGDFERIALAHRALGFTCNQLARDDEAYAALTRGIEAMRQHGRAADLRQYGEDGGLACRQYLAWVKLFRGEPDAALKISLETIKSADALEHAVSRAFARGNAASLLCMRGEADEVMRVTGEMLAITENHGLVFWNAHAMRNRGWALGQLGRVDEGLELLRQGDDLWSGIDARIMQTTHRCFAAELHGLAGQPELGLPIVREGLHLVEQYDDRWYHAELLRVEGWLLQLSEQPDQARVCFERAIAVARQQKNAWWLLRAANSQAVLLSELGDADAARDLLAPIRSQFSEGFDTKDLRQATALLQ